MIDEYKINKYWTFPIISTLAGFGTFWLYRAASINVWFSILIALYISAIVRSVFDDLTNDKKGGKKKA